jgi:hypothetical protein
MEDCAGDGSIITMFPRIHSRFGLITDPPFWSDFAEIEYPETNQTKFLDYEFIYDPKNFLNMEGGEWQVFRKNCRKFPRRVPGGLDNLKYIRVEDYDRPIKLEDLFISWLKGLKEETLIQEEKVILRYLVEGKNRKILADAGGIIYGINIWDENYYYLNYRYCFCRKEDFLSEFMRLLFYTDSEILNKNKFVNDGGCLGSEALKKFKEKMNPVKIREVRTHYRAGESNG